MNSTPTVTDSLLRLPVVEARTGLKKSSIYSRMKSQDFPAAIKLGARTTCWSERAIDGWIAKQLESATKAGS